MKEVSQYGFKDTINIPAMMMPSFRVTIAHQNKIAHKILIHTWGGLGDEICAEPTVRYIVEHFKDCEISLAAERPELFQHLKFHKVFDLKEVKPIWENYFVLTTITPPNDSNLVWQFMSHLLVNCVDFTSLCAIRQQLPVASREVILKPADPEFKRKDLTWDWRRGYVFVHAGKHWQSKTFPKEFWDAVLAEIVERGCVPVLIGADTSDNRSTVDVDTKGCLDLRNKLSIMESVWALQRAKVLLTNDSSPLHMAVTGDAWIGYVATCKHPDMISHWRKGQWAWRMKNFSKGGIWEHSDYNPNSLDKVEVENVGDLLQTWLPDPKEFAAWAVEKSKE